MCACNSLEDNLCVERDRGETTDEVEILTDGDMFERSQAWPGIRDSRARARTIVLISILIALPTSIGHGESGRRAVVRINARIPASLEAHRLSDNEW